MRYETARGILAEAMKYAQDAIPAVERMYMLTYSPNEKNETEGGNRKFVGKLKKNPKAVYEGAYKGAMEDWLTSLPKPAIDELKAKHGKDLAHTGGAGYKDIATKKTLPLHKSIVGILRKHKVKPFAHNIHDSSHAIQMSFHTYHGDMNEAQDAIDNLPPSDSGFWQGQRLSRPSDGKPNLFWRVRSNPGGNLMGPESLEPRGSEDMRRLERLRQLRDRLNTRKPSDTVVAEAAPDIGQNLKGMPKRAGRKLAYASKRWGKGEIGAKEYRVADERHVRKMGSNARRFGKKLDKALTDFSARTGIKLK